MAQLSLSPPWPRPSWGCQARLETPKLNISELKCKSSPEASILRRVFGGRCHQALQVACVPRLIRKRFASAPALAPPRAPAGASLTDQVIALRCCWTARGLASVMMQQDSARRCWCQDSWPEPWQPQHCLGFDRVVAQPLLFAIVILSFLRQREQNHMFLKGSAGADDTLKASELSLLGKPVRMRI